jgi:Spy/CpxP family protein refolding chaperone
MRFIWAMATLATIALVSSTHVPAQLSPYAGQQTREIKSLSAQEIDDLLNSRGMALAKAAELNGYPGPLHTLELSSQLSLTPVQLSAITEIKSRMASAARLVGVEIIERERALDRQFAAAEINKAQVEAETERLGNLQGRLRAIHLVAHLETKVMLNAQQISRYNELRGYSAGAPTRHDPPKAHGG